MLIVRMILVSKQSQCRSHGVPHLPWTVITFFEFPCQPSIASRLNLAFDSGRLPPDGGVMLVCEVERRLGLAERPTRWLMNRRDPSRIECEIVEVPRPRILAIGAGCEDATTVTACARNPCSRWSWSGLPRATGAMPAADHVADGERAPED